MKQFIKQRRLRQLFAWSLGMILLWTLPVEAQKISGSEPQTKIDTHHVVSNQKQILSELAQASVVYLGETHDNPDDHKAELDILQNLHQRKAKMAIAMEMFQRPYQGVLDQYLAGQLNEQELLEQTQYERRWGFPWEYYAPILRFAKEEHLPVLAVNTPTEVTRKVAREGLESLTQAEHQFIPPCSEVRTDNPEYRQMALAAFQQHQAAGHGSSSDESRFFLAQVLWDETMAESVAKFLQTHPGNQVIVLAGQTHIIYGYGIPSRVARRLRDKKLFQRSVLLSSPEEASTSNQKPVADFIWPHQ